MFGLRMFALVLLAAVAPLPFVATTAQAAAPFKVSAKKMEEYERTTREVFKKLVATMKPIPDINWDRLELRIVDFYESDGKKDYFNAFATMVKADDGKVIPVIYITRLYLESLEGDADGTAYVLGHELGHHFHGHLLKAPDFKTPVKATAESHRVEADADNFGAKLLLKAGYSLRNALAATYKAVKARSGLYSSAEGSWYSHPGEADRLARMAKLLDEQEETLWRSMAAFENGVYFLTIEDYVAAEACFLRVIKEFPNCAEAWANLGMARLMMYLDKLSPDDIRKLDIGQFVAGVRFRHVEMRADPRKMMIAWKAAEEALLKALKLKPKSATVLVGLGLAYLVCPERTDKRMQQADDYLAQAYALVTANESDLEPEALAALLINRGVVRMAKGDTDDGQGLIRKAEKVGEELKGADAAEVQSAVLFNKAMAYRADGKNAKASETFKTYLLNVPSSSPWWSVAYKAYVELQMALGLKPQPEKDLAVKESKVRRQVAVKLANGQIIHVGESVKDVHDKLGKPATQATDSTSGLQTLNYPALGLIVIADDEEVFGFTLSGDKCPTIVVKERGQSGKVLGEVRVGMTREEVEKQSGVTDWLSRRFTHLARTYPYSPGLGVALIYGKGDKKDTVVSILIGSIPGQGEEVEVRR